MSIHSSTSSAETSSLHLVCIPPAPDIPPSPGSVNYWVVLRGHAPGVDAARAQAIGFDIPRIEDARNWEHAERIWHQYCLSHHSPGHHYDHGPVAFEEAWVYAKSPVPAPTSDYSASVVTVPDSPSPSPSRLPSPLPPPSPGPSRPRGSSPPPYDLIAGQRRSLSTPPTHHRSRDGHGRLHWGIENDGRIFLNWDDARRRVEGLMEGGASIRILGTRDLTAIASFVSTSTG
ncbi:hypothetical protein C8F01DRAFT_1085177 [Mycena amicta]|nr:hypothetical protein C8F01DRAFT_1085177 [Mycena amicta]